MKAEYSNYTVWWWICPTCGEVHERPEDLSIFKSIICHKCKNEFTPVKVAERKDKLLEIIHLLSEIDAKDLDAASVEDLAQLQFWLSKHQGSIFVKTVGRLAFLLRGDEK